MINQSADSKLISSYEESFFNIAAPLGVSTKLFSELAAIAYFTPSTNLGHSSRQAECNGICEQGSKLSPFLLSRAIGLTYSFPNEIQAALLFQGSLTEVYESPVDFELRALSFSVTTSF